MGNRTGRKTIADKATRERALAVARDNPEMTASAIAQRFPGVTARQIQYWVSQERKATSKP